MNCTTFVAASKPLPAAGTPLPATPAADQPEADHRRSRSPLDTPPSAASPRPSRSPTPVTLPAPGSATRCGSAVNVPHPSSPVEHRQPAALDESASPLALEAALQRLSLRRSGREPRLAALREPPPLRRRPNLSLPPPPRGVAEDRAEARPRAQTMPWQMDTRFVGPPGAGSSALFSGEAQQHASSALGLWFGPQGPFPEATRGRRTAAARPRSPEAEPPEEQPEAKRHCRRH